MALKPHQRPIVTRFAFVMPMRNHGERVVPCEPDEAQSFAVWEWEPHNGAFAIPDREGNTFTGADMGVAYRRARAAAEAQDLALARLYGVAR